MRRDSEDVLKTSSSVRRDSEDVLTTSSSVQGPELVLGLLGIASLRSICRKEMTSSLFYGDNNLHQTVIETFYAFYRVTTTFGDDHTDTIGGPGTFT
ncbi:unnamed protein product [Heligmosomoides polygyrus]|uniref:Uncharacterized protein n=1 Tax=Heligmosomoides polygyrus TaxID=6339 RepID=A0A183G6V4_HELPZ|nr:unnamed protein product [Heligmosomoides polygyrus]